MKKGTKHSKETLEKISKNREVYNEAYMMEILPKMIEYTKKTIKGTDNEKVHLKTEILVHFEIWNPKWFANMAIKYSENKKVFNLLKACSMICEVNSYKAGVYGGANPILVKANLAHHYNWKDKTDISTKEQKEKTDEEIDKEIEEYEKRNK